MSGSGQHCHSAGCWGGIIAAADRNLLRQHGGSLVLTKAWAKSLLSRIGFVKRKGSTSAKVPAPEFEK